MAVFKNMNWRALEEELARWRDAGRTADFWWRDDDATKANPALARLLRLSKASGVPVALAVVPLDAAPELFAGLDARVLLHGTDHCNRAAPGEKKTEFAAAEPADAALERLRSAYQHLARLAGPALLPVLAPPWNRFKRELIAQLPRCELRGLSGYGARAAAEPVPGVTEVNTHVDLIDWRGTRGFVGEEPALRAALRHLAARRTGRADAAEPTGVLTHHALHDEATWSFLERVCERTRRAGARWHEAGALFPSRR
jgi:hypothetical protein